MTSSNSARVVSTQTEANNVASGEVWTPTPASNFEYLVRKDASFFVLDRGSYASFLWLFRRSLVEVMRKVMLPLVGNALFRSITLLLRLASRVLHRASLLASISNHGVLNELLKGFQNKNIAVTHTYVTFAPLAISLLSWMLSHNANIANSAEVQPLCERYALGC